MKLVSIKEWFLVFWIFVCSRVISQYISGWSCITVLLCSSQNSWEEKGLVYKTVTKPNYWTQSCILVWTQRLILLPIVTELTNPLFDVHVTVHRDKFLTIKPTRCTNFSNLFLEWKIYMFRTVPLSIIRSFHCTHSSGIRMLYRFADSCSQLSAVSKPL